MEKIYDIIYSALMAYGNFGIALGAIILALFIVQIALHLGIYGRVASFRLMNRKQIRESEPAISTPQSFAGFRFATTTIFLPT